MFGTCVSPCKRKIWLIQRWWKNSPFFKNWLKLKDQMVPPECGHFFDHVQMTSIVAQMISCTNNARFPRFCIFFNFIEFIMPSRLTAENIGVCLKGALSKNFFQKFLSQTCLAHVCHHVQENLGDLEVVEKFTFFQKLA